MARHRDCLSEYLKKIYHNWIMLQGTGRLFLPSRIIFQIAEVAISRQMFAEILTLIARLR
jgi:hypothetical protein